MLLVFLFVEFNIGLQFRRKSSPFTTFQIREIVWSDVERNWIFFFLKEKELDWMFKGAGHVGAPILSNDGARMFF